MGNKKLSSATAEYKPCFVSKVLKNAVFTFGIYTYRQKIALLSGGVRIFLENMNFQLYGMLRDFCHNESSTP